MGRRTGSLGVLRLFVEFSLKVGTSSNTFNVQVEDSLEGHIIIWFHLKVMQYILPCSIYFKETMFGLINNFG